jgi:hypothetical protein
VGAVAFSPDGRYFLTGTGDPGTFQGAVQVWDAATRKPLGPPLPSPLPVTCAAFSPDGGRFATGSGKVTHGAGELRLYETASRRPLGPALPHPGTVLGVAFSPDGRTVVSGSRNPSPTRRNGACLWDAASGRLLRTLPHPGDVCTVAFSPDGGTVLTGGEDGTARLWRVADGEPRGEPLRHHDWVLGAAFSPDGRTILTGCLDKTAQRWDADTGGSRGDPFLHQAWVRAVAFSPDGQVLLTGGGNTVQLWEAASCRPLGVPLRHDNWVTSAAFSPDSRILLTGSTDRTARLWPLRAPPVEGSPERLTLWAQVLTGKEVSSDGSVRVLDGRTWAERRRRLEGQGGAPVAGEEPPGPPLSADRLAAWHEQEAKAAEEDQNYFAAVYHLDRLLATSADPGSVRIRRARAHLSLGHWGLAAADFARARERESDESLIGVEYGAALLLTDDREAHRRLCARFLERYRDTTDPHVAFRVARLCTQAPDAGMRWDDVVRLAERAKTTGPTAPWVLHLLGRAYYRAGRPEDALRCLADSEKNPVWCHSLDWLLRALVLHSLGETAEARKWLDKAVEGADVVMVERPRELTGPFGSHPHDWVDYHVLRREAEAKLKGTKP